MFEEVVGHVLDGVLGFLFFLGQLGEGLQDEGHDGFVEVGSDGEGFDFVLYVLN